MVRARARALVVCVMEPIHLGAWSILQVMGYVAAFSMANAAY